MFPERRKIVRIVRCLPKEKLVRLLRYAEDLEEELTSEDVNAIDRGKAQIARGESISLDEFCRKYEL